MGRMWKSGSSGIHVARKVSRWEFLRVGGVGGWNLMNTTRRSAYAAYEFARFMSNP